MFDLCTMLELVWKGVKVASSRADATIINIVSALALVFHFPKLLRKAGSGCRRAPTSELPDDPLLVAQ
jgi:hypothetical protein